MSDDDAYSNHQEMNENQVDELQRQIEGDKQIQINRTVLAMVLADNQKMKEALNRRELLQRSRIRTDVHDNRLTRSTSFQQPEAQAFSSMQHQSTSDHDYNKISPPFQPTSKVQKTEVLIAGEADPLNETELMEEGFFRELSASYIKRLLDGESPETANHQLAAEVATGTGRNNEQLGEEWRKAQMVSINKIAAKISTPLDLKPSKLKPPNQNSKITSFGACPSGKADSSWVNRTRTFGCTTPSFNETAPPIYQVQEQVLGFGTPERLVASDNKSVTVLAINTLHTVTDKANQAITIDTYLREKTYESKSAQTGASPLDWSVIYRDIAEAYTSRQIKIGWVYAEMAKISQSIAALTIPDNHILVPYNHWDITLGNQLLKLWATHTGNTKFASRLVREVNSIASGAEMEPCDFTPRYRTNNNNRNNNNNNNQRNNYNNNSSNNRNNNQNQQNSNGPNKNNNNNNNNRGNGNR